MEFYRNQFVVQVDRSHGWRSFRVISTKDGIRKMIESLSKALEQPESELRPNYLTKDAPTPLWQEYVPPAFRRSDRKRAHIRNRRGPGQISFMAWKRCCRVELDNHRYSGRCLAVMYARRGRISAVPPLQLARGLEL